jgi:hypothetical protein
MRVWRTPRLELVHEEIKVMAAATVSKGDPVSFRTACLVLGTTLPAYAVFLVVCYLLSGKLDYRLAIVGGMGAWLAVAGVVFLAARFRSSDSQSFSSGQIVSGGPTLAILRDASSAEQVHRWT